MELGGFIAALGFTGLWVANGMIKKRMVEKEKMRWKEKIKKLEMQEAEKVIEGMINVAEEEEKDTKETSTEDIKNETNKLFEVAKKAIVERDQKIKEVAQGIEACKKNIDMLQKSCNKIFGAAEDTVSDFSLEVEAKLGACSKKIRGLYEKHCTHYFEHYEDGIRTSKGGSSEIGLSAGGGVYINHRYRLCNNNGAIIAQYKLRSNSPKGVIEILAEKGFRGDGDHKVFIFGPGGLKKINGMVSQLGLDKLIMKNDDDLSDGQLPPNEFRGL